MKTTNKEEPVNYLVIVQVHRRIAKLHNANIALN